MYRNLADIVSADYRWAIDCKYLADIVSVRSLPEDLAAGLDEVDPELALEVAVDEGRVARAAAGGEGAPEAAHGDVAAEQGQRLLGAFLDLW